MKFIMERYITGDGEYEKILQFRTKLILSEDRSIVASPMHIYCTNR